MKMFAVHDAACVRVLQPLANLDGELDLPREAHAVRTGEAPLEVLAL